MRTRDRVCPGVSARGVPDRVPHSAVKMEFQSSRLCCPEPSSSCSSKSLNNRSEMSCDRVWLSVVFSHQNLSEGSAAVRQRLSVVVGAQPTPAV